LWNGPNGIANPNSAITTITGVFQGTFSVILKVTDNNGAVGYDTVHVTIIPANRPLMPAQLIPIGTLSQARAGITISAAGNKILFAGGSNMSGACASSRVDIYDIGTNLWTTAELSQARYGMGAAALGNKIFFGGGWTPQFFPNSTTCFISSGEDTRSSRIDIYDASTNTWSTTQLSTPRIPQGASAGNKVIFAGGDPWNMIALPSNVTDTYDASTNIWNPGSLSESKGLPQIATSGNKMFLAGGAAQIDGDYFSGISKRIDIYDAAAGQWSVDFLSIERASMGSIGANNKVYWGGGIVANPDPNINYNATSLVEIRDLATNTTTFDCLSEPRDQLTAIRKDNKIIFFGNSNATRFDIYDLTTNSWSIGVLPQSFYSASIIAYNNIIYIVGSPASDVLSNHVWKLEF
jgi:N-acetylneuraminic acid mutarotase